ncbi:PLP-dependent aminotransferase family protein [Mycolicibacterium sp. HK-90]|uniref:MocR-like pyridoxine biosynthesis transcription factor PdxR n=1 Tax=Mycolicibacterium sp. HK-90 TaxID=3056937 RepID=UPI00265840C1|nr:PLP-dependent aminotransferase family protein [Mycolicibacterium sp. HK-90]WKG03242.1 PLP-dependent aminotransferase family protein [Mycolicibacterium sp. HK-90]
MATSGTSSAPELLVELDRNSKVALHRQLADGLRDAVRSGRLSPGSRMPSTRVLSADLGVSRRLVVEAYGQLTAEGFLHSTPGGSTRVAAVDTVTLPDRARSDPARPRFDIDFAPGSPDLASLPRQAWLRAMRQGLADIESSEFGYVAPHGLRAARTAVADYLRRTRGVIADPRLIVLCSGATQAIALLARCLDGPLAMEDPGFWLHRMVLQHNGIDPLPISVDDNGIDVDALASGEADTVLTTPAHQSPTGVVLSASRRTELLEWAQPGRLIIEDDYDAEYRYDRAPIGALQGVAPDRVVYIGSTSKTLAPGLRIGWMVVPEHLIGRLRTAKSLADTGSSVMDQIAFSQFLASGAYDRHLRQMRRRYPARRNALLAALSRHLPRAEVLGAAAGVHLTVRFPTGFPIDELTRRAAEARIRLEPLAPCYADPAAAPPGLILGYANVTESQIARGVEMLGRAARQLGAT